MSASDFLLLCLSCFLFDEALVTLAKGGIVHSSAKTPRDVLQPELNKKFPNARLVVQNEVVTIDGTPATKVGVDLDKFRNDVRDGRVFVDDKSRTVILSTNVAIGEGGTLLKRIEVPFKQNDNGEWRADFSSYDMLNQSEHGGKIRVTPLNVEGKIETKDAMRRRHFG